MKINRYSAKCKLCKAGWTTEETDRTKAFDAHEQNCPKYTASLARRIASRPKASFYSSMDIQRAIEMERYQMSVLWFSHIQITGRYVADKACDGRCMGATGHNCECSCGGKNHGVGSLCV
jgi:hypothetical protein